MVLCTPRVVLVALCISRWTSLSLHVPRTHRNTEYAPYIFADCYSLSFLRFYRKSLNVIIVFTFQWPIELESLLKFINVLEILSLLYHHLCNNWKSDIDSQILFARLIKHSIFEIVSQLSDREWIINWNTIPAFGGGGNVCKWKIKFL